MSRTIDIVARAMAAKAGSGSEGKQDRLVSGENIQYINGHDILGPGNLAIRTWQEFNPSWPTTGLTKSLCDAVNADPTAVVGMGYMGEVTYSDLPFPGNAEIQVEVYKGTGTSGKVIHLVCTSGNVAPYRWEVTYWNNGTNYSGWQAIGGGSVNDLIIDKTWAQLKALRDNGELIPGMKYRITNYSCVTTWPDTQSAGHDFCIIVTALSNKELSEDAKADYLASDSYFIGVGSASFISGTQPEDSVVAYLMVNDHEETYIHQPEFNEMGTSQGVPYLVYDDDSEIRDVYNYIGRQEYKGNTYDAWECTTDGAIGTKVALTNIVTETTMVKIADLPAWQLKYCLDNDAERFSWAQPGDDITAIKVKKSNNTTYIYLRYPSSDYTEQSPKGPIMWQAWAYVNNSTNINFDAVPDWTDINTSNIIYFSYYSSGAKDHDGVYTYVSRRNPTPAGKGVIYWMKDEHNNEAPYDFKNIQFKRYKVTRTDGNFDTIGNRYSGMKEYKFDREYYESYPSVDEGYTMNDNDFMWCYTFNGDNQDSGTYYDLSTIQYRLSDELINLLVDDGTGFSVQDVCHDNIIKEYHNPNNIDGFYEQKAIYLNNIVCKGTFWQCEPSDMDYTTADCHNNVFDANCRTINLEENCFSNHIKGDSRCIVLAAGCNENIFELGCKTCLLESSCNHNSMKRAFSIKLPSWSQDNVFDGAYSIKSTHQFVKCTFDTECHHLSFTSGNAIQLIHMHHGIHGSYSQ